MQQIWLNILKKREPETGSLKFNPKPYALNVIEKSCHQQDKKTS